MVNEDLIVRYPSAEDEGIQGGDTIMLDGRMIMKMTSREDLQLNVETNYLHTV